MATDHGTVPASVASWTLISTVWPRPLRSRSIIAASAPMAPYTDAQSCPR